MSKASNIGCAFRFLFRFLKGCQKLFKKIPTFKACAKQNLITALQLQFNQDDVDKQSGYELLNNSIMKYLQYDMLVVQG